MEKNKFLKIRIDDYTDEKLTELERKYKMTRSEIVRKSIGSFDADLVMKMFGPDMMNAILFFDGAYTIIDFGIAGKNYIEGKGFWLYVHANFIIKLTTLEFNYGTISVIIEKDNNNIYIDGGFLNDIRNILSLIHI